MHAYLLVMGFQIQWIFREGKFITGFTGEIFIIVIYSCYFPNMVIQIAMPVFQYLINSSDF